MTQAFESIDFKFLPLNFSWIALHPKPVGVIYFIGGALFGTFPTIFYRSILRYLFNRGYTIVALPYRFTFRHWSVATALVADQVTLQQALMEEAKHRQYDYTIYERTDSGNYFWLGHSLGCKYIALMEVLTDLELHDADPEDWLARCIPPRGQRSFRHALSQINLRQVSLKNQSSILMAPAIEGLEGAIPILRNPRFAGLKTLLNRIGIKVEPSQAETFCLAQSGQSFNLTSLISFQDDTRVAGPTVRWLRTHLSDRLVQSRTLQGRHLAPLGWGRGDREIAETVERFLNQSASKITALLASLPVG